MTNVFVKNVDKQAYKMAKMIAVKEEKTIGEVISESLLLLARQSKKKGLSKVKPVDFGPGTKDLSTSIDDILYGE